MTKIFDALVRAGGDAGRIVRRAVDRDAIAAQHQAELVEASVRVLPLDPKSPVLLPFGPGGQLASEQYRFIRTRIAQDLSRPKVIAVSSGHQGDGKTVTAINLAAVLSMKEGTSVLLIDADMRRCSVARELGLPGHPGLADVLTGRTSLTDALIRAAQYPNLFVLPAGTRTENAADLLDSPEWKTLCSLVSQHFRSTIVDSPPAGPIADYELIQDAVDKVLLVIRPDRTPRAACFEALSSIPRSKLLGVALNAVEKWPFNRYSGYYYQNEAYSRPAPEPHDELPGI